MKIGRMFINDYYKGTRDYLKTQKNYEIARTVLYFAISASLFSAGWISTGSRENLLTIVAVLGCLPACKSAVDMIMYLRYKGCTQENAEVIAPHAQGLPCLHDMVFTSYEKTYNVAHITVCDNTICGFTQSEKLDEQAFYKHMNSVLKKDGYKETSIKIFKDIKKYTQRLDQMQELEVHEEFSEGILTTMKSVSL
jgi:hypothetical protein